MISFKKILEQKLAGEYNKVCKLTSVFDIMKLSTTIRINFDEAQQLITKACSSFGVVNPPKVIQARGKQEYQIFGKIFLRQPTTVHAILHELAHYLMLGKNDPPKKIVSKKLLKLYYNVESLEDLNDEDRKEALIYATKFRFEPHGPSFVSKLDELLKWWKEYECKYKLSEQKEISSYKTFYHGTTKDAAKNILENGININNIRLRDSGDLGWGFYVSFDVSEAKAYSKGAIIVLHVDTSDFAHITDPVFFRFKRVEEQTAEEKLFYNIAFRIENGKKKILSRNNEEIAKKIRQTFLLNKYKGIETETGETVIFDSSCIKSIAIYNDEQKHKLSESFLGQNIEKALFELGSWIDPNGKIYKLTKQYETHKEALLHRLNHFAYTIPSATTMIPEEIDEETSTEREMRFLHDGWIAQRSNGFLIGGQLTRSKKDIIFIFAKDHGYDKIYVDSFGKPIIQNEPPEALYECKYQFSEQINPIYKLENDFDYSYRWWIDPDGKTYHFP